MAGMKSGGLMAGLMVFAPVLLPASEPVRVASLSTILTDVVGSVGGEWVVIDEIVDSAVDPHEFEPAPGEMQRLSGAELIVACGLGFEVYLDRVRDAVGEGPVVLALGEGIEDLIWCDRSHLHDHGQGGQKHEHDGHFPDPHWWQSIGNMRVAVIALTEALVALRPEAREYFEANGRAYLDRLDALEQWVRVQVASLPRQRRILLTSHDALGYFARDHDFTILAVQGLSTVDEPGSREIAELIRTIRESGVNVVFAENAQNPRVLQEITRETGARLGGVLYVDALGEDEAATYEDMMRHNVSVIVGALRE